MLQKFVKNSTCKTEPTKYTIRILKRLLRDSGVRGYSGERKAELIKLLQGSDPQPQTWKPHPTKQASPLARSKKPPKKNIKQLERKKRKLVSRIRSNPKLQEKNERQSSRKIKRAPTREYLAKHRGSTCSWD